MEWKHSCHSSIGLGLARHMLGIRSVCLSWGCDRGQISSKLFELFVQLQELPDMEDPTPARITVLISGGGTNLQALIDACGTDDLPNANIVRVISDRKDAYGLTRAKTASIPTTHHGILRYKREHPDSSPEPKFDQARRAYDADLAKLVLEDEPDLVVCAGFMRILTTAFVDPVKAATVPIINLHPAKPGELVGAKCIDDAWDEFKAGKRTETGIMIHYVIEEVDMGAPIVSTNIDITGCESLKDLETRIHASEHPLIVKGAKTAIEKLRNERKV
ncbi:Bifunctional purine biosynthetic protein ADE5,7 [Elasticomyces elasticus]|nr:Bifunctional purine biosynthetic protein ADE5,7 [Elasticomyces elasticus]